MSLRKTVAALLIATAALAIVMIFTGAVSGWVPVAYVLFVAAVFSAFLIDRLRNAMPAAKDFGAMLRRAGREERQPDPFELFRLRLVIAGGTQWSVHVRLRPLVQRIASARLSYKHGIDLEREPERAAGLLRGTRVWELIRPDREAPEDDAARGWREDELRQLVEELEKL
jgi:hypothetical protein